MAWFFNLFDDFRNNANSTSQFAFKGQRLEPLISARVDAVISMFTPVIGGEYKFVIARLDASNVIQEIVSSDTLVAQTATPSPFWFPMSTELEAGVDYALMIGRLDAGDTYPMPLYFPNHSNGQWPCDQLGYARLAKANPQIGDTVDTATQGAIPIGLSLAFI